MFGILKDNKPEILKKIKYAITDEDKRLRYIKEDVIKKLSSEENFDSSQYILNLKIGLSSNQVYKKEFIVVKNASSREMFQALNKICSNTEYIVDNDTASGMVKGYDISLMRHKDRMGICVSIDATYKDLDSFIQNIINEYNSKESSNDIPNFINDYIE